ncbi:MAG: hypothetical protein GF330_12915, partial [Candidatus Eisenbacteria bacterium]|nr:hypothetical protein [Candidatus Eisenbacteria bacterium]
MDRGLGHDPTRPRGIARRIILGPPPARTIIAFCRRRPHLLYNCSWGRCGLLPCCGSHKQGEESSMPSQHPQTTVRACLPVPRAHRSTGAAAIRTAACACMILVAVLMPAPGAAVAEAAASRTWADGDPHLVPLGPGGRAPSSAPEVHLLDSDGTGARIIFELAAIDVQELTLDGESFHLLGIRGGGFAGAPGAPMLPTFARLVQIPPRSGVVCEVLAIETQRLEGIRPLPTQPPDAPALIIDRALYDGTSPSGQLSAAAGDPALAGDLRVVPISFSPVRYDPAAGGIEIATRIEVELRFEGRDPRNVPPHESPRITPSFDRLYRQLVIGYQGQRDDSPGSLGKYVFICPDHADILAALEPLIEWRTRKGFDVVVATTTETGGSASEIQAWLRDAYATWEVPPEYVTLVGDVSGYVGIPCWWHSGGESDHPYVQLAGDDLLADAHIGRLSVESLDRLELVVDKMVDYESTPYMLETDWYTRACLLGDPSYSGISCIQVMQWLKERLLEYGYTEVDTIFTPPWTTQFTNYCNRGDTVFSYRGYGGVSGIGTGHIYSLTNQRKLPLAVTITCGTGNFASSTCYSEAWLRAGSNPDNHTGGIAGISTSGSTHTRYNNCMTYGIWRAVFWEDLFTFGEALTRGKYELYINYHDYDYAGCSNFTHWNNLMGDPAGEIWTAVPELMGVSHPARLPQGTNSVTVSASDHGVPISGAQVCLWKGAETFVSGRTGADGSVELPVSTWATGEMKVTVTKHDHQPYLAAIPVAQEERFVAYSTHAIDDDEQGGSLGNDDGLVNPTETIELPVRVRNFGRQSALGVSGSLTCDDPYITLLDAEETFGDIPAGASAWTADDFDLRIDPATPAGHIVELGLDLASEGDVWHSLIQLPVTGAELAYIDATLHDFGEQVDPGEEGTLSFRLANLGDAPAEDLVGTLVSHSDWVTITDDAGGFGTIEPDGEGENDEDRFALRVSSACVPGHLADLEIDAAFSNGARDTIRFQLPIGTVTESDPTGPDAYGYYAFDNLDTAYDEAPVYDWVEIASNHGGPGTAVGLSDYGGDNDDSRVVDLPFPFLFYGETFTQATICTNGWIAMGATDLDNRRNWIIPGAGAPQYLIAPMWDNLYQTGQDVVYHWFDADQHRYIVQWSRLRNNQGNQIENFELILYNPAHYPTATGDGEIVFQYETFADSDYLQQYSTIGIQNRDRTDGVLYRYYNQAWPGAASVTSGSAIRFTPFAATPRGTLSGIVTNATNGGTPLPDVVVRVQDTGQQMHSQPDGTYAGAVPIGVQTIIAEHPSFASDTVAGVWIVEDQVTELDFALDDIAPPSFPATTALPNTADETGPYPVEAVLLDHSAIDTAELCYNLGGAGWTMTPLSNGGDSLYAAEIPGAGEGTLVKYYLTASDVGGHAAEDPPDAPWESYEFWVLPALYAEQMESGAPDWIHYPVTDTLTDQWHLSQQRNHTAEGSWSWKCGDPADGDYAPWSDGALESPALDPGQRVILSFWHWMEAETSAAFSGYAYDGGLVEISSGAGQWRQIEPLGGYPYLIREGSSPGPFEAETPVFSGAHDWRQVHFEVPASLVPIRFRFRFGSDGAVAGEG